jgi:hypothetical protein
MKPEDIQVLSDAVESRNKKHYDWMRSLVLLASGALTVMVSLHSDKQLAGVPLVYMKVAWVSLGLGILLGAVSLHGEVWMQTEATKLLGRELSKPDGGNIPVHVALPLRYRASATICCLSLVCAVVSFVLYAVTRY